MSSKSTIFLTNENDHCFDECCEYDGNDFRLYLEVDKDNIKYFESCQIDGSIILGIKGNSDLAKILRSVKSSDSIIEELNKWKYLSELAEDYIKKSTYDTNILEDQLKAYRKWNDLRCKMKQDYTK